MQPLKSKAESACGANFRIRQLLSSNEQHASLEDQKTRSDKLAEGNETEVWTWQGFFRGFLHKKLTVTGGLMLFIISCSSLTRTVLAPPEIAGANYAGD